MVMVEDVGRYWDFVINNLVFSLSELVLGVCSFLSIIAFCQEVLNFRLVGVNGPLEDA